MKTVTTLDDKVRAFKVLLDRKDELAEQTKANNEELKNLEQEIAQQMVDEEKPDTTVDGFKYGVYVKQKLIYVKADDFGPLPAIGRQIVFDGKRYIVTDSTDEGGVYTITMEANRTK